MGTLDDIASMRREGRSDNEISSSLKQRGLSEKEISSVMNQTRIKDAVSGFDTVEESSEMSPSLMSPEESAPQAPSTDQIQTYQDAGQDQTYAAAPEAYGSDGYQQQYSSSGIGTDLISEIADQIVTEKLSPLIAGVDKIMDMRSSTETQLKLLDERMKRIEKIIDRLQLSILQRVGEYVSNVEDIKREMVETQKTFKALAERK